MAPPVLALRDARLSFGGNDLFAGISLNVGSSDRISLVGRNGSGKSTLLKVLAGLVDLDEGERFVQPGLRVSYLPQDPDVPAGQAVGAYVAKGLAEGGDAEDYRVQQALQGVGLAAIRNLDTLSGGERRRAALARALVSEPDVLLLDEPTNHLDLATITWLEETLAAFAGAIVTISHDRAFLRALTRRTFWLDRCKLHVLERGFAEFDAWSEKLLEEEEQAYAKLEKKVAVETHWSHHGISARRKRNQGRLRRLEGLRAERAAHIKQQGKAQLAIEEGAQSGRLVVEAEKISKSFTAPDGTEKPVVKDFSIRIMRGDRIGLIGPNGAGKTTLLKLLTGQMEPDSGTVRLGTNLEPAYFDQHRAQLDPDETLWRTLAGPGGDQVMVRGQPRHVVSYLRDFLFQERQARSPVSSLSGGERNRLLLAKLLARSSNFLILDEPTNDLDMDTLDLLQEILGEYEGTLLIVSHDRDFLDRLVTSIIAVEGEGRIREFVGGYEDYLRQRQAGEEGAAPAAKKPEKAEAAKPPRPKGARTSLSYKDKRELEMLPERIAALEVEIEELEAVLADPNLFARDPDAFNAKAARLDAAREEHATSETRWLELEMQREELEGG